MKSCSWSVALTLSCLWSPMATASLLSSMLGKPDIQVITVTDMTEEGRARPAPTPGKPEYYEIVSLGFRDLGGLIAGVREPQENWVIRLISAELAKRGYLPVTRQSPPPSLVLVYAWGTLNVRQSFGGFQTGDPSQRWPAQQTNLWQIAHFLGGDKVGLDDNIFFRGLEPYSLRRARMGVANRRYLEAATDNYYVAVVTAYTFEQLQQKELSHLWITRIACPSTGYEPAEVLPTMIAFAGPHFGHETARPVWDKASEKYLPHVEIGELVLVEYLKITPCP